MVFGSQSKLPPRADVSSARRLLKYWDGSRVEAEGRMARSEGGASPQWGCNDRATRPAALLPRAVNGCVDFGVGLRCSLGRDRCGYRPCARALANSKIHSNATHPSLSTVS